MRNIDEFFDAVESRTTAELHDIREKNKTMAFMSFAFVFLLTTVMFGVFTFLRRLVISPLNTMKLGVETFGDGDYSHRINNDAHDELGRLSESFNSMAEKIQDRTALLERQRWIKTHEAEIGAALNNTKTTQDMTKKAMSMLCPLIKAQHGLFFVFANDKLELFARYGGGAETQLSYALGEGLVGQCAIERKSITVTTPPKEYIRIKFGIGEIKPAVIIILPVLQAGNLCGVIELAALEPFSQSDLDLLDELIPVFGNQIELLERNLKAETLLKESKEQAERLEEQTVVLEERSVELETQQAELAATEEWYRSIIAKAPDGVIVMNAQGVIILSNLKAEELFGYEPGKMNGLKGSDLVPVSMRGELTKTRETFVREPGVSTINGLPLIGLRANGAEFSVEMSLSQLPDIGGRGTCLYASIRDATESTARATAV